jgi:hypothetical protein
MLALAAWQVIDAPPQPGVQLAPWVPADVAGEIDEAPASALPQPPAPVQPWRGEAAEPAVVQVGDVDVCGYGTVTPADDDFSGLLSVPGARRKAALQAAQARLLASADEEVRAAGLLIAGEGERLAVEAAASRHPAVYAMALQSCRQAAAPACALLSVEQWARLDAGNAVPWLALAAEALQRGDAAAEADAMGRAVMARRFESPASRLPALIDRGLGPQAPALPRTLALMASWQAQSAWDDAVGPQALRHCGPDAPQGRRPLCEGLAHQLLSHAERVDDFAAGVAIAGHLGWPAARLQELQREADALTEAARLQAMLTDLSCDSVERVQQWRAALAEHGEVLAARALLARSGFDTGWWSEQHRKNLALALATAEAAGAALAVP